MEGRRVLRKRGGRMEGVKEGRTKDIKEGGKGWMEGIKEERRKN